MVFEQRVQRLDRGQARVFYDRRLVMRINDSFIETHYSVVLVLLNGWFYFVRRRISVIRGKSLQLNLSDYCLPLRDARGVV